MDVTRRTMIKGVIGTVALKAFPAAGLHAEVITPSAAKPLLLMLAGGPWDAHFHRGVREATEALQGPPESVVRFADHLVPDPDAITRTLREWQGFRAIGFMEDGMYAVFQELARDVGARLECLGRHVWNADGVGGSRHRILSARDPSPSLGTALTSLLAPTGRMFRVAETMLEGNSDVCPVNIADIAFSRVDGGTHVFTRALPLAGKNSPVSDFATLLGYATALTASSQAGVTPLGFQPRELSTSSTVRMGSAVTVIMDL